MVLRLPGDTGVFGHHVYLCRILVGHKDHQSAKHGNDVVVSEFATSLQLLHLLYAPPGPLDQLWDARPSGRPHSFVCAGPDLGQDPTPEVEPPGELVTS